MFPYQSIVVVGGGTAGWLAAAYLQKTLANNPENPISITLIESEDIETIGVGEATVPTLRQTLRILDIPESALFAKTEATLKNGIRFVGWKTGGDASSDKYDHPFDPPIAMDGYSMMVHWMNLKQHGLCNEAFSDVGVVQTALFDANLSPKLMHSPNFEAPVTYAYHLDAILLARLLKDTAIARGIKHVIGTVKTVKVTDKGIRSVTLQNDAEYAGDLFVDCTGFSAVLIGKALNVPWVSYSDTMLCDRAIANPVSYPSEVSPLRSYTTSTAKSAGWVWEIDLQSRRGSGYVYSSAFCTDGEAIDTLMQHNQGLTSLAEPRLLKMNIGHRERAWEKNCLAIGLSSGFIEPLESTGIYLIEHALQMFIDYLPYGEQDTKCRDCYNTLMAGLYDELRDFVLLHYVLSMRQDSPFWKAYTHDVVVPDSLKQVLELWECKIPSGTDINKRLSLFGANNWFFILAGMNKLPPKGVGQSWYLSKHTSLNAVQSIAKIRHAAIAQSPTMRDYAKKVRAAVANAPR